MEGRHVLQRLPCILVPVRGIVGSFRDSLGAKGRRG